MLLDTHERKQRILKRNGGYYDLNAQEIADIAERRFVQIIKKDLCAAYSQPYYYNLISWMIRELKAIPSIPLTESGKCETIGYDDNRLLGR